MKSRLRQGLTAALAAAVIAASAVGVAAAVSPAPVSGGPAGVGACASQSVAARSGGGVAVLRAFGDCEIDRRLVALSQLSAVISASKGLTSSDAAALNTGIAATRTGLTSLRTSIDGQTALPALKLEIVEIVTRYRVFTLLVPQVRLVDAADGVLSLGPRLTELSTDLAGRIAAAKFAGKDVTAAQAALDAMNGSIAGAESRAAPVPGRLLPLTPAQFDSGSAGPVLQGARTALVQARDALQAAAEDGRAVLAALK
jgi:hypothetical protein